MLFPTIRFAIFFAVVLPVSWLLMPLPSAEEARRRLGGSTADQPWIVPLLLLVVAAFLGPLAPSDAWPDVVRGLSWVACLGVLALAAVRWFDLIGLTRWNVFILAASYVFYGAYDWRFVGLLMASTVLNQIFTEAIHRGRTEQVRRTWLLVAVTLNLGVLAWFKYKGFFTESAASIFDVFGWKIVPPARALIPPVGISFFTFQALSYVIDTYRRKLRPVPLLDFGVYLAFFPHLVAGPIVRASEFLPQLKVPRDARRIDTGLAFWLIAAGLFKKVVVSSYLGSAAVDPLFRIPSQHNALDTLVGIYAYAIQIYCDFSGYTDMAIGLALLMGFRFPQNFDAPYTATSLQQFWRRWHMTLSRWLRDYVYIPLGGNQHGTNRAIVNVFLTMVIGGLWHGAAWTFVVWGAIHGTCLAVERIWTERAERNRRVRDAHDRIARAEAIEAAANRAAVLTGGRGPDGPAYEPDPDAYDLAPPPSTFELSPTARRWIGRFLTFQVVCLAWVFFRAPTLTDAFHVLARLFAFGGGDGINLLVVALIAIFLATQFVPSRAVGQAQATFSRLPVWGQGALLALWLVFTSSLAPVGVAPFIYFNF